MILTVEWSHHGGYLWETVIFVNKTADGWVGSPLPPHNPESICAVAGSCDIKLNELLKKCYTSGFKMWEGVLYSWQMLFQCFFMRLYFTLSYSWISWYHLVPTVWSKIMCHWVWAFTVK